VHKILSNQAEGDAKEKQKIDQRKEMGLRERFSHAVTIKFFGLYYSETARSLTGTYHLHLNGF
jgi:hypothetical protein